jgi:protein TonB
VLASIAAHALAAVTASVVLPIALRGEGHEVEIEVDLARADLTDPTEVPRAAPPTLPANQQPPSPSHNSRRGPVDRTPRRQHDRPPSTAPAEIAPPSSLAEPNPPARFSLPAGTLATLAPSPGPATGDLRTTTGSGKGAAGPDEVLDVLDVLDEKKVSVPARLISSNPVAYPPEARRTEIETDVQVQILVDNEGRVVEAHNLSRDGYGLDEAAVQAIRTYRFSPALRDGRPVRVRMRWTVQFRLR